jgi:type I restriction enzyme R subunit
MDFKGAEKYLVDNILDRPEEYFTLDKLRRSIGLDRKLTTEELLLYIFEHIENIKTKNECLKDEFEKFDDLHLPDEESFNDVKQFFESYVLDSELRDIIDSRRFGDLFVHPSGDSIMKISEEYQKIIPEFIKQNVDLDRFSNA